MKTVFACAMMLFVCGCAGPYAKMIQLFASADRSIEFWSGGDGAFGGNRSWALVDDTFVFRGEARQKKLPPEVAAEAWRQIEALEIFAWKDNYAAEDIGLHVYDGAGWSVRLRIGPREKKSGGHQAYPRLSKPEMTTLGYEFPAGPKVRTGCEALFEILRRCEKEANKAPEPTSRLSRPVRGTGRASPLFDMGAIPSRWELRFVFKGTG